MENVPFHKDAGLLKDYAESLAEVGGTSASEMTEILFALASDYEPLDDDDGIRFGFQLDLMKLIAFIGDRSVDQSLKRLTGENIAWTAYYCEFVDWMTCGPSVCYSIPELQQIAKEVLAKLKANQEQLIEHGHPVSVCQEHCILDRLLRNYYTLMPTSRLVRAQTCQEWDTECFSNSDPRKDNSEIYGEILDHPKWSDICEIKYDWPIHDTMSSIGSDLISLCPLGHEKIGRLRRPVMEIKLEILTLLSSSLTSIGPEPLFDRVSIIIGNKLSGDEVSFLFWLDNFYWHEGFGSKGILAPRDPSPYIAGGISDILSAAGFCVNELQVGLWSKTREELKSLIVEDHPLRRFSIPGFLEIDSEEVRDSIEYSARSFRKRLKLTDKNWEFYLLKVRSAQPFDGSLYAKSSSQPPPGTRMVFHEADRKVVWGDKTYPFPDPEKYIVVQYIADKARRGITKVSKKDIERDCDIDVGKLRNQSIRRWLQCGGLGPECFVRDCLERVDGRYWRLKADNDDIEIKWIRDED